MMQIQATTTKYKKILFVMSLCVLIYDNLRNLGLYKKPGLTAGCFQTILPAINFLYPRCEVELSKYTAPKSDTKRDKYIKSDNLVVNHNYFSPTLNDPFRL